MYGPGPSRNAPVFVPIIRFNPVGRIVLCEAEDVRERGGAVGWKGYTNTTENQN